MVIELPCPRSLVHPTDHESPDAIIFTLYFSLLDRILMASDSNSRSVTLPPCIRPVASFGIT